MNDEATVKVSAHKCIDRLINALMRRHFYRWQPFGCQLNDLGNSKADKSGRAARTTFAASL
jgi:hypothetical protein